MTDLTSEANDQLQLPPSIISRLDLSHIVTEVEQLDNYVTAATVHAKAGVATTTQPNLSPQLIDFLKLNRLQIGDNTQRSRLITLLRKMKNQALVLHMTFATEADQASLQQLATWARRTVHPQAVIAVGLQPSLIGGVYIRTPNHVHDLSVRAQLSGQHERLVKEVEALSGGR
jgi:F0F1-type ATP synthase delta subunit